MPELIQETAPLIVYGTLCGVSGLLSVIPFLATGAKGVEWSMLAWSAVLISAGAILIILAFGIRRQWRFALICSLPVCVPGLLIFPLGTLLFGHILFSLWRWRNSFYPFDRGPGGNGAETP